MYGNVKDFLQTAYPFRHFTVTFVEEDAKEFSSKQGHPGRCEISCFLLSNILIILDGGCKCLL